MMINPYDAAKIEKRFPGAKLIPVTKYEAGHIYFDGYWHEIHTVETVHENVPVWGEMYTSKWEDGHTTTHATRPDPRHDFEIII